MTASARAEWYKAEPAHSNLTVPDTDTNLHHMDTDTNSDSEVMVTKKSKTAIVLSSSLCLYKINQLLHNIKFSFINVQHVTKFNITNHTTIPAFTGQTCKIIQIA